MEFITLGIDHINLDLVTDFYWSANRKVLFVTVCGDRCITVSDPDQRMYTRLCMATGVRKVEESDATAL